MTSDELRNAQATIEPPTPGNELRLIVELMPVSPEEAASLAKHQLAAIRKFLVRLDEVRQPDVSQPGGNLSETSPQTKGVNRP